MTARSGAGKSYRAVLVGCGEMSKGWLRAIRDTPLLAGSVEIVGLVDLSEQAARHRAAEFELKNVGIYTDLSAALEALKPDLVFDVALPSSRHGLVATALAHGCDVLSEKPMASSLAEARDLVGRARDTDRIHAIVQNRRYVDGVRRIRALLESGVLGELTALHADFFIGAHFGGFREQMQNALLLDMAIHTFDAARFMANREPEAVYCFETNPTGSWYAHGAAANAIFELAGNVVFTYRGSWVAEGGTTSWESAWRIVGTKGTLLWDGADRFEGRSVAADSGFLRPLTDVAVPSSPHPSLCNGHASVITEFIEAVSTRGRPETSGEDNIKSLSMVFSAIESARARQRIVIEH